MSIDRLVLHAMLVCVLAAALMLGAQAYQAVFFDSLECGGSPGHCLAVAFRRPGRRPVVRSGEPRRGLASAAGTSIGLLEPRNRS